MVMMGFAAQHLVFHSEPEQTKAEDGGDNERAENDLVMMIQMMTMMVIMMMMMMKIAETRAA